MKDHIKSALCVMTIVCLSFTSFSQELHDIGLINVGKTYSFSSKILNEDRDIYISLPENYDHSKHLYPVIVVLDAEYLFDLTRSIVHLTSSRNYMPESIVVGIANNTGKRLDMAIELKNDEGQPFFYGDNIGQSAKYLDFLKKELFPTLSKAYRINDHRTIIGMSPTFGPVLEDFWSGSSFFSGHIVLAAEIGQNLKTGEKVADKLVKTITEKKTQSSAIYVGTSSKDIEKRGRQEGQLYLDAMDKLASNKSSNIRYKFEVVPNEDHYSMAMLGIKNGLETIYPREMWQISYREFWQSDDPAKALIDTYQQLSKVYGFEIVPIETAFYSINTLTKTAEILARQKKSEQLESWLDMALGYYPNSAILKEMRAQAISRN